MQRVLASKLPKIGVLTNQQTRCGNAEYGRDLVWYLGAYYQVQSSDSLAELLAGEPKAILVNWQPARVTMTLPMMTTAKDAGIKVIVIFQESYDWDYTVSDSAMLTGADAIVAHEKVSDMKVHVIPHGIPMVEDLPDAADRKVGIAGFPFPWKRFDIVVSTAVKFNMKCLLIAPEHEYSDSAPFIAKARKDLGNLAEIYTEWLPKEEVVKLLATCTMNIFWFESQVWDDRLGQSGSVRLGIAARRPVIISAHRKFKTLLPYLDELYMAATEECVYKYAADILRGDTRLKIPRRLLDDMGWHRTAEMYHELIEEMTPQKKNVGAAAA